MSRLALWRFKHAPARLLFSFSMMADKNKLYQEVFRAFKSAYPEKSVDVEATVDILSDN